ncbi:MAG: hypothetical protein ABI234_03905 [Ktedonobacteraceae bacterium]
MLKLKKVSAAFVLSLILGVSLFSTGAFANTHAANWGGNWGGNGGCGCGNSSFGALVIPFTVIAVPVFSFNIIPWFGGFGGFGGWGGGWGW